MNGYTVHAFERNKNKKGPTTSYSNFWPILVISNIAIIFEKIIKKEVTRLFKIK